MAIGTQPQEADECFSITMGHDSVRRQRIQEALSDASPGHVTFDALVNRVYECEYAGATDPVAHRRRVANALHYVHLPRLVDLGVIDYDPSQRCVTLTSDL